MTYDHEIALIQQTYTENGMGDPISVDTETVVLCGLKSIGRNEFYQAAATGLKPELIFLVHGYEYNGEQKVRFDGVEYNIIRSYAPNFEELELTCSGLAKG
jgi:SPP1 family predicted phage head-tail adaptor